MRCSEPGGRTLFRLLMRDAGGESEQHLLNETVPSWVFEVVLEVCYIFLHDLCKLHTPCLNYLHLPLDYYPRVHSTLIGIYYYIQGSWYVRRM